MTFLISNGKALNLDRASTISVSVYEDRLTVTATFQLHDRSVMESMSCRIDGVKDAEADELKKQVLTEILSTDVAVLEDVVKKAKSQSKL